MGVLFGGERSELCSLRATKLAAFSLRALCGFAAPPAGATFAASLTSKLADSALLGYLRRRFAAAQEFKSLPNKKSKADECLPCFFG